MHGLLEPILVKQDGDFYNLICGERRLTACRQLGLKTIAANIRNDIKDEDIFAVQIVENLHRKDLEPMELANAYKQLLDKYKSLKYVARFVGKSKSHVFDTLSILSIDILHPFVKTIFLAYYFLFHFLFNLLNNYIYI